MTATAGADAAAPPDAGGVAIERQLVEDGWRVTAGLMWVVEACRGADVEQAVGATREEALGRLAQLVRLDAAPHVP